MGESSTKPYLIRALHEWCTDNGYTPHIVVQVDEHTRVPLAHVRDGQITLNVGTLATNKLTLGNELVEFEARFNGRTEVVSVPIGAVSAIYARETGAGMGFEVEGAPSAEVPAPGASATDAVVGDAAAGQAAVAAPEPTQAAPAEDAPAPTKPDRPRLTIVK